MSHLAPGVILFEKRPRWESELKRGLAAERVLIRPCRSVADLTTLCRAMRGSVTVIDFETGPAGTIEWLQHARSHDFAVSPVVILPRSAAALEWPLREFGAEAVFCTPVNSRDLVLLTRSLLRSLPLSSPPGFSTRSTIDVR
jgi:hypothetical protein